jgi:rubredoxin
MAKYRCPSCGAAHKDPPGTCRLCGYVMDGSVAIPTQSNVARPVEVQKKGVASIALIGIILVVVLVGAAIVLNVTSGSSTINKAVDKLPGAPLASDGWKRVSDTQGGFSVELPPGPVTTSVPFAPSTNGQLTGWLGSIGDAPSYDTQLYVVYGKVTTNPGETGEDTIARLGDAKIAQDGFVESRTHTSFQGYPAIRYTINRVEFAGQTGYENALLFLKGDELFVVESLSIYPKEPATTEFNRVVGTLSFS